MRLENTKSKGGLKNPQRILSRSLIKLEAKEVSLFAVSPAMFLSENISCEAYKIAIGNENIVLCNFHMASL